MAKEPQSTRAVSSDTRNAEGRANRGVSPAEAMVREDLERHGSAYLDWGRNGNMYKNIDSETEAVKIADKYNDEYYVYYDLMGYGGGPHHIPPGTPVAIRISRTLPNDPSGYISYQLRHHGTVKPLI